MIKSALTFFSTGNSRNFGTNCSSSFWQEGLARIDEFIHTSNSLSLASADVIFQKDNDKIKIYREITGFVSDHESAPLELFVDDAVDRCCGAFKFDCSYDTDLSDIFDNSSELIRTIQPTEFPINYGDFTHFEIRLRMDFKTIDHLKSEWLAYMFFDRTSSSILTF